MKKIIFIKILFCVALTFVKLSHPSLADNNDLVVLSASSTAGLIHDLSNEFNDRFETKIKVSVSSSGILAKQVKLGIPANLIISASIDWIKDLEENNRIDPSYIKPIFKNSLILVRNINQKIETKVDITNPYSLIKALGKGKLVIGDPRHVPLGKYTVKFFEDIGIWNEIKPKTIRQINSRSVVNLIDRNEVRMGVIYQSDLNLSNNIISIRKIPSSNDKIVYYVAIITAYKNSLAVKFYNFLSKPIPKKIYEKFGFLNIQ